MNKLFLISLSVLFSAACSDFKMVVEPASPVLDPALVTNEVTINGEDPLYTQQQNLIGIGSEGAWSISDGNPVVKVAVISSGIDYNHEDLQSQIFVNQAEHREINPGEGYRPDRLDNDGNGYVDDVMGYDFVDNDGMPYDQLGHGTAAAGIIGALHGNSKGIRGVCKQISLVPVRYINGNGQSSLALMARALKYALAMQVDVAYLHLASLQFDRDPEYAAAQKSAVGKILDQFTAKRIPLVVNAGNSGKDISAAYRSLQTAFAGRPNVVVVTAVDEEGRRPFIANYSRSTVHTAAPGTNIMTTFPGNQYRTISGTFASAAHVAGALALGISLRGSSITPDQMVTTLLRPEASQPAQGMEFETIGANQLHLENFLKVVNEL